MRALRRSSTSASWAADQAMAVGLPLDVWLSGPAPVSNDRSCWGFASPGLVFGVILRGMRRMRGVGVAVYALAVAGVAGCGGGGTAGAGASSPPAAVAPRDALGAYERATASGGTDAADCQEFMTRKLAAAEKVRTAMKAKDASAYAVPIGYVGQA